MYVCCSVLEWVYTVCITELQYVAVCCSLHEYRPIHTSFISQGSVTVG